MQTLLLSLFVFLYVQNTNCVSDVINSLNKLENEVRKDVGNMMFEPSMISSDSNENNIRNRYKHYIQDYNKVYTPTFKMRLTSLSDLSEDDYRQRNGFIMPGQGQREKHFFFDLNVTSESQESTKSQVFQESKKEYSPLLKEKDYPDHFDWRDYGLIEKVQNQGQCGSCWSFSANGAIQGQYIRKYKYNLTLSEQNLMDCSVSFGNYGCSGGWMNSAFEYVMYNKGINSDQVYPYLGYQKRCSYNSKYPNLYIKTYVNIPMGDEKALQDAVYLQGPISVAMDASLASFQLYSNGTYYDPRCSSEYLDHAVLLIGFGKDKDGEYWIVKNSWGTSWGIDGYFKLARNKKNHCGIATAASYPVLY